MKPETTDWARVVEALEALRQELTRLGERVAALEAAAGGEARRGPAPPRRPLPKAGSPRASSEELVLVISAAIAAFLGQEAHIRQIRLLGIAAWAQQGRVTIQASHALSVHHG